MSFFIIHWCKYNYYLTAVCSLTQTNTHTQQQPEWT